MMSLKHKDKFDLTDQYDHNKVHVEKEKNNIHMTTKFTAKCLVQQQTCI